MCVLIHMCVWEGCHMYKCVPLMPSLFMSVED